MYYLIAIMVGFTIVVSMVQNARLAQDITNIQTTLMNFITGFIGITLIFLVAGTKWSVFSSAAHVPLFGFVGGVMGVTVVFLSTVVVRKISIIAASMLMYTGQMLAGFLIDWFRGIELTPLKIIGCGLIIAGIYYNAYIDNRKNMDYEEKTVST